MILSDDLLIHNVSSLNYVTLSKMKFNQRKLESNIFYRNLVIDGFLTSNFLMFLVSIIYFLSNIIPNVVMSSTTYTSECKMTGNLVGNHLYIPNFQLAILCSFDNIIL